MIMETSENINEIATALAKAQGQIEAALKDKTNPHLRSKYADLASVWDACRHQLSSNGIAIVQAPETTEKGVSIETLLCHSSGQWVKSSCFIPVDKYTAQGFGSAITYARRYSLAAFVGVAPDDDDGNGAGSGEKPSAKKDSNLPAYDDAKLRDNAVAWKAAIISGKQTQESIINMISTKHTLSDEQKEIIRKLGAIDANS